MFLLTHDIPDFVLQVSSSGNSRLWEKNRMLASLLAKQPSQPATIPPIPNSMVQATPNERLPKMPVDSVGTGETRLLPSHYFVMKVIHFC